TLPAPPLPPTPLPPVPEPPWPKLRPPIPKLRPPSPKLKPPMPKLKPPMPKLPVSKHMYALLRQLQITVPDWQALKAKPPPAPVSFGVHASPVMGVPSHGSNPGKPPPWLEPPVATGEEPPLPGEPPAAVDEPAVPGVVFVPAVPVVCEPPLDEVPPLPPPLSPELPPQAVAALKPNTKIPRECLIDSPRTDDLNTTLTVLAADVVRQVARLSSRQRWACCWGNRMARRAGDPFAHGCRFPWSGRLHGTESARCNRHGRLHDLRDRGGWILDGCNFPARVSPAVPL